MHLTAAETRTLIGMTPSARHLEVQDIEASEITATAAVNLTLYGPA
nr:hypothetical protein GCM10020092_010740 [Actinoplanes digitatis]